MFLITGTGGGEANKASAGNVVRAILFHIKTVRKKQVYYKQVVIH